MNKEINTQVVVLGSGPAGYSAAFRCADLNLNSVIVEQYENIGGTCLNVGCIPSKTLLHITKIMKESLNLEKMGVTFSKPEINLDKIRIWKNNLINKLTNSLRKMAISRKVNIIQGFGKFYDSKTLIVNQLNKEIIINFEHAIIATGSQSIKLPFLPNDHPCIWDSTDALELKSIPSRMLIIGGGIIGLELATIYQCLGSHIDIIELSDQILPSLDKDVIKVFHNCIRKKFSIFLEKKVIKVEPRTTDLLVTIENKDHSTEIKNYDIVLVCIGRIPNILNLGLDNIGIKINSLNFINVDKQLRTNVDNIFAIGDVIGPPMLAHKGIHEGHIAAEVISGKKHIFDPKVIPSITYTDPEIAWVGLTEKAALNMGIKYEPVIFPWSASGRANASGSSEGITKLIFNKDNNRIIGGTIVGSHGGELLGEITLAIEMGCDAEDLSLTIHAHPTLHESIGLAAEIFEGTITDLPNLKTKIQ